MSECSLCEDFGLHSNSSSVQRSCQGCMLTVSHVCRTLNVPVTDIVRTGDKMVVLQEGMRNANGSKVSLASPS